MDDGLKQRLVGAIVLIAIAVIFVPTVFNPEGRRAVDTTSQVPPEPVGVVEPLEVEAPEEPENIPPAKPREENYNHQPVEESGSSAGAETPEEPPATTGDETTGEETESQDMAEPAEDGGNDETEGVLTEEGTPRAWSIQVASFSEKPRADKMLQSLRDKGYTRSYIREAQGSEGTLYRVFVGPKINRQEAEDTKAKLDKDFNINSLLVHFKP